MSEHEEPVATDADDPAELDRALREAIDAFKAELEDPRIGELAADIDAQYLGPILANEQKPSHTRDGVGLLQREMTDDWQDTMDKAKFIVGETSLYIRLQMASTFTSVFGDIADAEREAMKKDGWPIPDLSGARARSEERQRDLAQNQKSLTHLFRAGAIMIRARREMLTSFKSMEIDFTYRDLIRNAIDELQALRDEMLQAEIDKLIERLLELLGQYVAVSFWQVRLLYLLWKVCTKGKKPLKELNDSEIAFVFLDRLRLQREAIKELRWMADRVIKRAKAATDGDGS